MSMRRAGMTTLVGTPAPPRPLAVGDAEGPPEPLLDGVGPPLSPGVPVVGTEGEAVAEPPGPVPAAGPVKASNPAATRVTPPATRRAAPTRAVRSPRRWNGSVIGGRC